MGADLEEKMPTWGGRGPPLTWVNRASIGIQKGRDMPGQPQIKGK